MQEWQRQLTALIKAQADVLVGFGSLEDVPAAVDMGYRTGISIGHPLPPEIVAQLSQGPTLAYHEAYCRLNETLDRLDRLAADWLIAQGLRAHPLTRAHVTIEKPGFRTTLPHKTVALRAGHGWIGRSALLVTPEYGPAVRFSSVLTDIPLEAKPLPEDRCGGCNACRDACPAKAVAGVPWAAGLPREAYYSAEACQAYASARCADLGVTDDICGICINACPYTRKYLRKQGALSS